LTTPTPPDGAMAAARGLTGALDGMSARLDAVRADSEERDAAILEYGRTNRRMIRWLIISVTLDVALTVIVGFLGIQARDNAVALQKTAASNLALCEASNVARHQQIDLWDFLLSLGKQPQTAAQRKTVTEFKAHLTAIYQPRDCAHLRPRQ
jgi:hypothetical protein